MTGKVMTYVVAALLVAGAVWRAAVPTKSATPGKIVLRISHFRPSIPATVQKARGNLERRLGPLGVTVQWNEFTSTTDSMLALSSGAIDLSVGGIEGALMAIASGVPLRIAASGPHRSPKTGWFTAILVPRDSPIKTLADLKGKKIAVGRGGFAEAVLAVAVRKGGWSYPGDVEPEYLTAADGADAFTGRLVDAVLTLDPYIPSIQRRFPSRILTDNEQLGYPTIWDVAVNEKFASEHADVVDAVVDEFLANGPWVEGHRTEAAASLARVVGFDAELWETTLGRASYLLEPPGPESVPDIQYVADRLLDLSIIHSRVDVAEHLWPRDDRSPTARAP
jgi:sulfonate transport system substrate-binding protein